MTKAPAFQFYAQDFLTGVIYLTNEEIGIYIKMLAKQWTDGKIPKKRLGFLVGYEWDKLSDELKEKFEDLGDYVLNERLEKEREKRLKFSDKQAENGKKGGRPKKNKKRKDAENTDEETQTKPNPFKNQNPNESQKKPLEDEVEDRSKKKEDKKEKGVIGEKTNLPWKTENFKVQWDLYKVYRRKKDKFSFLNTDSENRKLKELEGLSEGDEKKAIKILQKSIDSGWKGIFKLDEKTPQGQPVKSFAINR